MRSVERETIREELNFLIFSKKSPRILLQLIHIIIKTVTISRRNETWLRLEMKLKYRCLDFGLF